MTESPAETPHRVIVRFSGEISTKSRRTRSRFQRRLVRNLRDAFDSQGIEVEIETGWSRLFLRSEDPGFMEPLPRVFGISSFSSLLGECAAELDEIVGVGTDLFAERVRDHRYAVRARRSGTHDFSSDDIHRQLGAALNPGATVDLDDPEVVVRVEVRRDRVYFYSAPVRGADGLPLGVQGRAIALLSGGFDSAVAAFMALRRGILLDYVFCNLGGEAYKRMVVEVAKVISDRWSYGTRPRLHVLDFVPVVEAMRARAKPAYLQVVLKRFMYRAASAIGSERDASAIVTGESIGQVSSQTLRNLHAIDNAADLPVLRPLLGFHKEEIITKSREIGTHDLSARVREYCRVAPGRPVTAASPEEAGRQEAAVGGETLEVALAERETLDLGALRLTDVVASGLFVSEIPEGSEVVDTRNRAEFEAWHWPGAVHRDLEGLERDFRGLERGRTYVFYCPEGVRTAHLAERMQARGYEAYSFRGGASALRRHAERALAR